MKDDAMLAKAPSRGFSQHQALVELSRHSHVAPLMAQRSILCLRAAEARVKARATLLLSTAAVLLLALAGGGYVWLEFQAQQRQEDAERRVTDAL